MHSIKTCFMLFLVSASLILAQPTEKGLYFSQSLGFSYNPLGVILPTGLQYRFPFINKKGILWESTKIELGILNEWTPTDNLFVARLTFVPIAFFELSFQGGPYVLYRQMGYGYRSFSDPDAPYDDDALENIPRGTKVGYWLTLTPVIKLKIASIIAANAFNVNILSIGDKDYFLEMRSYSLRKYKDTDITDDTFLFYEINDKIMVGANYHFLRVISTSYFSQRLCGVFLFTPKVKAFYSTTIIAVAGAYFEDTLFKGKPYIAIQAGFDIKVK